MFDSDLLDGEFEGGVFSSEIEGGRAGASIHLNDRGLTATLADGQQFHLAYSDCNLELGGASGRMVFCRTASRSLTVFCENRRFPAALDQGSAGQLMQQLEEISAVAKKRRIAGQLGIWTFAVACLVVLAGGWYAILYGARAVVVHVPFTVDEQIGEAVYEQALNEVAEMTGRNQVELIEDDAVRLPLQQMVDDLALYCRMPNVHFQVLVCDTDIPNAVALPGGRIIVFRGLIDLVETPEELLAVLAHEMSHVTLRHHLRTIGQSIGVVVAVEVLVGDVGGLVALGAEVMQSVALLGNSREHEHEADLEGVRILYRSGIDPGHAVTMLESLPDAHGPEALTWLRSHPQIEERVQAIRELVAEFPPRQYSEAEFDLDKLRRALKVGDREPVPAGGGREPSAVEQDAAGGH